MARHLLRLALPDAPGTLGAVATELGTARINILSLRVVEVSDGIAVDEVLLDVPPPLGTKLGEIVERVAGVVVESVRHVPVGVERWSPLDLAEEVRGSADVLRTLVESLPAVFDATWAIAIRQRDPQVETLAGSLRAPGTVGMRTPWMPLRRPRSLRGGPWMGSSWSPSSTAEFAAAPLDDGEAVLVMRQAGPRFTSTELETLGLLAGIATLSGSGRQALVDAGLAV